MVWIEEGKNKIIWDEHPLIGWFKEEWFYVWFDDETIIWTEETKNEIIWT